MGFGENIQFLRKMSNRMTQEELAEKLSVSRQTISKWELNQGYPEMSKIIDICDLFSCSMDQLFREDMYINDEAFSDISTVQIPEMYYVRYSVVSPEPEDDALTHINSMAKNLEINNPEVIGWDFPFVSQEQVNVFHMHGYTAALVLNEAIVRKHPELKICHQSTQKYISITVKNPFLAPFQLIPNAYKVMHTYMQTNGLKYVQSESLIHCYEKSYKKDHVEYMDIFIAVE